MVDSVEHTWLALVDSAALEILEPQLAERARAVRPRYHAALLADADVLARQPRAHHQFVAAPADLAALHHLPRLRPRRMTHRRQTHRPRPVARIPARRRHLVAQSLVRP